MEYYDHDNGRIYGNIGPSDKSVGVIKELKFPSVVPGLYAITEKGIIINRITQMSMPYNPMKMSSKEITVNLSCIRDGVGSIEPFKVSELMASSFISNSGDYLERGCKVRYKDGNSSNLSYDNLEYV